MRDKRWRARLWLLAVLAIMSLVVLSANAGSMLVVDAPQRSDVILVLAGDTDSRPARALELLHQGFGRRVVIDVPAEARTYGFSQVQLAEKYIQDLPESASISVCAIEALSTRDESHDAEKCLAHQESARILLVTSDFHTRRVLSIFRHELPGKSFSVAAAHDEWQFGPRWWTHREWAKTCLYEWMRLLWWTVVDRWR